MGQIWDPSACLRANKYRAGGFLCGYSSRGLPSIKAVRPRQCQREANQWPSSLAQHYRTACQPRGSSARVAALGSRVLSTGFLAGRHDRRNRPNVSPRAPCTFCEVVARAPRGLAGTHRRLPTRHPPRRTRVRPHGSVRRHSRMRLPTLATRSPGAAGRATAPTGKARPTEWRPAPMICLASGIDVALQGARRCDQLCRKRHPTRCDGVFGEDLVSSSDGEQAASLCHAEGCPDVLPRVYSKARDSSCDSARLTSVTFERSRASYSK